MKRGRESIFMSRVASKEHFREGSDGGNKTGVFTCLFAPLHPEIDDGTSAAACEAIPVVLGLINTEAFVLIVVERTVSLSALVQFNKLADEVIGCDAVFKAFCQRFAASTLCWMRPPEAALFFGGCQKSVEEILWNTLRESQKGDLFSNGRGEGSAVRVDEVVPSAVLAMST